jgi:hypothetical protein
VGTVYIIYIVYTVYLKTKWTLINNLTRPVFIYFDCIKNLHKKSLISSRLRCNNVIITRRVTGQSFVCSMVYIGMVFTWAPSVLVTLHRWLFAVLVTLHRWLFAVIVTLYRWMH